MSELPEWLWDRISDRMATGVMPGKAYRMEYGRASDLFGTPLPEEDPYERARREAERRRIERIERAFGDAYDRQRLAEQGGS